VPIAKVVGNLGQLERTLGHYGTDMFARRTNDSPVALLCCKLVSILQNRTAGQREPYRGAVRRSDPSAHAATLIVVQHQLQVPGIIITNVQVLGKYEHWIASRLEQEVALRER
jgi:hypothetical protein